jgi:glycosyltransferase involved in cell wall biosynthesis
MHVLIVHSATIPVETYGDSERIIWWLGKELVKRGCKVTYLVKKQSSCPFADVLVWNEKLPLDRQIPNDIDLVHMHTGTHGTAFKPCMVTVYESVVDPALLHPNTVFLSADHARRHGSNRFIYPGIDLADYGKPDVLNTRRYFHYLGNQAIAVKTLKGAIDITVSARERLHVIGGGSRINLQSGLRITLSPLVRFHGMIGGDGRNTIIQSSRGLVYPAATDEPFGLNIIESLYFGCPVFGTPKGALPELLGSRHYAGESNHGQMDAYYSEYGVLSTKQSDLSAALPSFSDYDRQRCQDYAAAHFTVQHMTDQYLKLYEKTIRDSQPAVVNTSVESKELLEVSNG